MPLREVPGTSASACAQPISSACFSVMRENTALASSTRTCVQPPGAAPSSAAAWQLRTTGAFRLVELAAGHFFLEDDRGIRYAARN